MTESVARQLSFSITRRETGRPDGFELGDLTISGPDGTATSIGKTPDQGMMIYIAIADLMEGVAKLVGERNGARYELVGADSSFIVWFERRGDALVIRQGKTKIAEDNDRAVAGRLLEDVDRFWKAHPLDPADSCRDDLLRAREELCAALRLS